MKKLLLISLTALLSFSSCTKKDCPKPENKKERPPVSPDRPLKIDTVVVNKYN
jgi:hypothetical protein